MDSPATASSLSKVLEIVVLWVEKPKTGITHMQLKQNNISKLINFKTI
jgi:hypothetical protein